MRKFALRAHSLSAVGMAARIKVQGFVLTSPAIGCKQAKALPLPDHYFARLQHEVRAESELDALHDVWDMYQNLDENHLTPDGKQSMQTGDLVHVISTDTWWMVLSIGWGQIETPLWAR